MEVSEQIKTLHDLAQLDVDALGAYDVALAHISQPSVRERLEHFREEHLRHVVELNSFLRLMGAPEVELRPDVKGAMMKGFTTVSSWMGTEATLLAMMGTEELTNRAYDAALRFTWDPDLHLFLVTGRQHELHHVNWIRDSARSRAGLGDSLLGGEEARV